MTAQHGTITMGINHGCGCDDCTAAVSGYRAEYRATHRPPDTFGPSIPRKSAWSETEPRKAGGDPRWQDDAACKGADPGLFFPKRGDDTGPAKAICRGCPVREACADYALVTVQRSGIWGGLSERERRALRGAA